MVRSKLIDKSKVKLMRCDRIFVPIDIAKKIGRLILDLYTIKKYEIIEHENYNKEITPIINGRKNCAKNYRCFWILASSFKFLAYINKH